MSKGWSCLLVVLPILASTGCDCWGHVACRVVDASTGTPLANAKVVGHFISDEETWTDSTGTFALSGIVGHLGCPRVKATLSAPGYLTSHQRLTDGEQVRLKRAVPLSQEDVR